MKHKILILTTLVLCLAACQANPHNNPVIYTQTPVYGTEVYIRTVIAHEMPISHARAIYELGAI